MPERKTISWEEAVQRAERAADALLQAQDALIQEYPSEAQKEHIPVAVKDRLVESFLHDLFRHFEITEATTVEEIHQEHASAEPSRLQKIQNSVGMEFVRIPAGEFLMGSPDFGPVHLVRLSQPFYLGKYEVTQGQWEVVMGNNPSRFQGDPNRPVERVSWEDVQEFIQRLNTKEGVTFYRLPTEAEWEYAARSGSTTNYSFGDDESQLGEYGWFNENSGGGTHPVGQLKPNPWGLYDMHGNVWEWVQDWYGEYSAEAVTDPQGLSSGSSRVLRGGSWSIAARNCRSAVRNIDPPGLRPYNVGFRLLRMAL